MKEKLSYFLKIIKKMVGGATSQKTQKEKKSIKLHYYSSSGDDLGIGRSSMIHFSSPYGFEPLSSKIE